MPKLLVEGLDLSSAVAAVKILAAQEGVKPEEDHAFNRLVRALTPVSEGGEANEVDIDGVLEEGRFRFHCHVKEAKEIHAENERLRAWADAHNADETVPRTDYLAMCKDRDRLRAENERLRAAAQKVIKQLDLARKLPRSAHSIDVTYRADGHETRYQADWVKYIPGLLEELEKAVK